MCGEANRTAVLPLGDLTLDITASKPEQMASVGRQLEKHPAGVPLRPTAAAALLAHASIASACRFLSFFGSVLCCLRDLRLHAFFPSGLPPVGGPCPSIASQARTLALSGILALGHYSLLSSAPFRLRQLVCTRSRPLSATSVAACVSGRDKRQRRGLGPAFISLEERSRPQSFVCGTEREREL